MALNGIGIQPSERGWGVDVATVRACPRWFRWQGLVARSHDLMTRLAGTGTGYIDWNCSRASNTMERAATPTDVRPFMPRLQFAVACTRGIHRRTARPLASALILNTNLFKGNALKCESEFLSDNSQHKHIPISPAKLVTDALRDCYAVGTPVLLDSRNFCSHNALLPPITLRCLNASRIGMAGVVVSAIGADRTPTFQAQESVFLTPG